MHSRIGLPSRCRARAVVVAAAACVAVAALAPSGADAAIATLNTGETHAASGTTTTGALRERYYDNGHGAPNLDPITNLTSRAPTEPQRTLAEPLNFTTAQLDTRYTKTTETTFALTWTGKLDITTAGAYTFGTRSDDGSTLFIDLNNDGDFVDANELTVNNNGD